MKHNQKSIQLTQRQSRNVLIGMILILELFLTSFTFVQRAHAEDALGDLQLDTEIAISDSQADQDEAQFSNEMLHQEQSKHQAEISDIRQKISESRRASQQAQLTRKLNEKQIAQLQSTRALEKKKMRAAQVEQARLERQLSKTQKVKSQNEAQLLSQQKRKEAVVQQLKKRQDASLAMDSELKALHEKLKNEKAAYKKAIEQERLQKLALQQKKLQFKKQAAKLKADSKKVRTLTREIQNRGQKGS